MRIGFKHLAVAAVLLMATAGTQGLFANCTNFGAGFPIFQCGFVGYFEPAPPGAGNVRGAWWQVNMGNATLTNGRGGGALEGTGILPVGVFSGNDSGAFNVVLTEARSVLDPASYPNIPVGAKCFLDANSWSQTGVDGCADNPRTSADDDNKLNKYYNYFGADAFYCTYDFDMYGFGAYTHNYQLDYPMGVVLQEDTGQYFSLAMVASRRRGTDQLSRCLSTVDGDWLLSDVSNGLPNPDTGANNVIPWQMTPKATVTGVACAGETSPGCGGVPTADRMVAFSVNCVDVISDQSVRPSSRAGMIRPGVGVLDMGNVVRYVLEQADLSAAADPGNPQPGELTWVVTGTSFTQGDCVGGVISGNVTVPPDTALRVRTFFGQTPRTASQTPLNCRVGACGDIGIEPTDNGLGSCHLDLLTCTRGPNQGGVCAADVDCFPNGGVSPPMTLVGGALVSEKAVDTVAEKNKNVVKVSFRTTSELSVDSIDIISVGNRGEQTVKTIACKQCTTGVGATYDVLLTGGDLKGAKNLKVRLNGPGTTSDSFPVN